MSKHRRGICPGVYEPLESGDGHLARWTPHEAIPTAKFIELCDLSSRLGNGIIEVTQRGSIQIRGLPPGPAFGQALASLGVEVQENPPVVVPPSLAWEETDSAQRARRLLGDVLAALRKWTPTHLLAPKVSILLDHAGSSLNLDSLPADIRLFVRDGDHVHVSIAKTSTCAVPLGWVSARDCATVLCALLTEIAELGTSARGTSLGGSNSRVLEELALALGLSPGEGPSSRSPPEYVGAHGGPESCIAQGFALAFGYASSETLKALAVCAARIGALAIRPAPDRTLLIVGIERSARAELAARAEELGLIHEPSDPRRYLIACAGAPLCGSGVLATRDWAPRVAAAARGMLGPNSIIHLSGCTKGCAYPHVASLTFAGPDRVIFEGRADSEPAQVSSIAAWVHGLEQMTRNACNGARTPRG